MILGLMFRKNYKREEKILKAHYNFIKNLETFFQGKYKDKSKKGIKQFVDNEISKLRKLLGE
jgi:predicted porin